MIAFAASVASAAGLGGFAVGLGCLVAVLGWFAAGWGDWLLGWGGWLQSGQASGRAGALLLSAISAGLIHENQPTVCKGNAFSWNKYQK